MGLAEFRVELECAVDRRTRLARRLRPTARAQKCLNRVGVCQSRIGHRVVGRPRDRLLEIVDALVHLRDGADQKLAPFEVQAVSLWVGSLGADEPGVFVAAQLAAQRAGDRRGDLAFNLQQVVRRARIFLAPQLGRVTDPDEFCSDRDALTVFCEAAEDQRIDPEFLADLRRIQLLALKGEGGRSRYHAQALQARKLVDQAFRYAIAEVFDGRIAAGIFKRQHRDQSDRRTARSDLVCDQAGDEQQGTRSCDEQNSPPGIAPGWERHRRGRRGLRRRSQAIRRREEMGDPLHKRHRELAAGSVGPLDLAELVRNQDVCVASFVDDDWEQERSFRSHQVRPVDGEFPLESKVPLDASLRVRRNEWHEQGAGTDLPLDRSVPRIAATQFALVQPDLGPSSSQSRADPLRRLRVLRGVADKDSAQAAELSRLAACAGFETQMRPLDSMHIWSEND